MHLLDALRSAVFTSAWLLLAAGTALGQTARPNIVIILADDLGYGDVSVYNPDRGKIPTPHIDRLAGQGIRFTNAHSSSGVCSPSRYTLLTGRYHWRTRLQSGIVNDWEAPLIAPDRLTIAGMLKAAGYQTAAIGKWHLGWDWPIPGEQRPLFKRVKPDAPATDEKRRVWAEVFARPIAGGPTTRGFDSYFGTDVPNWPPYCFIENDRTVGIPSTHLPPALVNGRIASVQGPALENWTFEPILPAITDRAVAYIGQAAAKNEPYFLYLPLTAPHTPISVNEPFKGRTGLGEYADFVVETDAMIGRVIEAIDKTGEAADTLVILTSDNGCAFYVDGKKLEAQGHYPSGPLRGYKFDVWDGGTRVPFIVRWPAVVKQPRVYDRMVAQADIMATVAQLLGIALPDDAGEDSFSFAHVLRGSDTPVRSTLVTSSGAGQSAVRTDAWKLIFGSDGRGKKGPGQLYAAGDIGETNNLYTARPQVVKELTALMRQLVDAGRSTPGPRQPNDRPVTWQRFYAPAGK